MFLIYKVYCEIQIPLTRSLTDQRATETTDVLYRFCREDLLITARALRMDISSIPL